MYYFFWRLFLKMIFDGKKFNKHLFCTAPSPKKDKARKGVDRKAPRRKAPKKNAKGAAKKHKNEKHARRKASAFSE